MENTDQKITIIVSTANSDYYSDSTGSGDVDGNTSVKVDIYNFEDIIKENWFKILLYNNGFYSQNDVINNHTHLDEFLFEYKYSQGGSYYTNKLNRRTKVTAVYQRCVGGEKIEQCEKHNNRN
jgi:hypothetical protein